MHRVVAIGHHSLAETAGVDAEDQIDRLVEIGGAAQVVPHDDGHPLAADRDRLAAASLNEKSHFAACGDETLAYATLDLAMLDDGGGAHRTAFGQHGNTHDGRDTAAMRSDLVQRLLAKFDKRRFAQQIQGGRSAEGLLGEDDEIGALGLGPLDGADDFRLVPFNVADRIIQLSKSDFHLSGILIFQYILCKGNDYLEKLARFLLKYAARRLALRRNSGSHGTGCRQHADTAPCKPPRNPAVRPSATAASRPAIGGKKTCSRPAATAPEARPAGHRKKREVPPRKRRNLRYVPLPDYSSAPSGSATRIRPQYSQMMIFLP